MILYVTEQGAEVHRRQGRLQITKGPALLQSVHLFDLEQLVLLGQVQVSTQAVRALLARGTDTVYLTMSGRFLGRLSAGLGAQIGLRRVQFQRLERPEVTLDLARRYVEGKLRNCLALLRRHNRTLRRDAVARECAALRRGIARLPGAEDLDQVRGIEGAAAARYFAALRAVFRAPGMAFFRRARRPPPDPINILLSLGYTLLTNLVHGVCEEAGLDPYLGALHAPARGRPSLPLDLIEELRPVLVDAPAIRAVNTRRIGPADFIHLGDEEIAAEKALWRERRAVATGTSTAAGVCKDGDRVWAGEGGRDGDGDGDGDAPAPRQVIITSAGLKKWILAFEQRLEERVYYPGTGARVAYRQLIREQVRLLARHLRGVESYAPFVSRG